MIAVDYKDGRLLVMRQNLNKERQFYIYCKEPQFYIYTTPERKKKFQKFPRFTTFFTKNIESISAKKFRNCGAVF
jgi:hypothetical protein